MCIRDRGQFDQVLPQGSPFRPARESRGPDRSLAGQRSYVLEVNGGVAGGRLQMAISYSENLHRRATIDRLARHYEDALRAIIVQASSSEEEVTLTPEDFPLASLNQKDLTKVLGKLGKPSSRKGSTHR
jgi:non-ribosomal peptide synthase protein (TIGR01720 family)